mgnify:CR=1 FL=1|jgi:hypothetical protein
MGVKEKKKFKDTKLANWLKSKAPDILRVVGDVAPDAGILGIVSRLIDTDPKLGPEDREQGHSHLKELYALEVSDRDSARQREVEVSKTRNFDLMFNLTGIIGLSSFAFIIYAIVYLTIPESNKEVWIHLIGITEGIVLSIFGYFFGSAVRKNRD